MPQVTGPLTTTSSTDVFGTHDSIYGIDGYRSVANKTARNAITSERRRAGMLVCTQDDMKIYQLNNSPWAGTDADWTLFNVGTGTAPTTQEFDFPTPVTDWIMDHTLGGFPDVIAKGLDGIKVYGDVSYPSTSRVIVHHDIPGGYAGHATLTR